MSLSGLSALHAVVLFFLTWRRFCARAIHQRMSRPSGSRTLSCGWKSPPIVWPLLWDPAGWWHQREPNPQSMSGGCCPSPAPAPSCQGQPRVFQTLTETTGRSLWLPWSGVNGAATRFCPFSKKSHLGSVLIAPTPISGCSLTGIFGGAFRLLV